MSSENDGSVQAGNPDGSQSAAANGSATVTDNSPFTGLQDADNRSLVEKKGWKTFDDGLKSYRELESKFGSALTVPANDAPPEAWDKVYSKLGRPEKPDAYEFKRPDNLPKELPYDEALAGKAKGWSHEAGLNNRQAQIIHDRFASEQSALMTAHLANMAKEDESAARELEKEWGPQDSDGFKTNVNQVNIALQKLGLLEDAKALGFLRPNGNLTRSNFATAMKIVFERIFAPDTIDGAASIGGDNPFKTRNLTAISTLVAKDPDRARALAKEAGVDPDIWVSGKKKNHYATY